MLDDALTQGLATDTQAVVLPLAPATLTDAPSVPPAPCPVPLHTLVTDTHPVRSPAVRPARNITLTPDTPRPLPETAIDATPVPGRFNLATPTPPAPAQSTVTTLVVLPQASPALTRTPPDRPPLPCTRHEIDDDEVHTLSPVAVVSARPDALSVPTP